MSPFDDLTEEELAAVVKALRQAIDNDCYPLSPRLKPFKSALAKLDPRPAPAPRPPRPPLPEAPARSRGGPNAYAEHCRGLTSEPARYAIACPNGTAKPVSLAYYGGPQRWHELRLAAQEFLEPYVFEAVPTS